MKTLIPLALAILPLIGFAQKKIRNKSNQATINNDTIYIPIDLNDAIRQLDLLIADSSYRIMRYMPRHIIGLQLIKVTVR